MRTTLVSFLLYLSFMLTVNAQPYYYNPDISNILDAHGCTGCHGSTGGLSLNTYDDALAGGLNCGPAFLAYDVENSPIYNKSTEGVSNCAGGIMPPVGSGNDPVSAEELAIIAEWINTGALESAATACADLVIAAYTEGASFNKCIELYNGTGNDIDLGTYSLDVYSNGNDAVNASFELEGTITDGGYFLVCHPDEEIAGLNPDFTANFSYNGNDAIALNNGTSNIDVFGQIGVDPSDTGWMTDDCMTENQTWVKLTTGDECMYGSFSGTSDFSDALGNLYECSAADEGFAFNSFTEEPAECPELTPLADAGTVIDLCPGESVDLMLQVFGAEPADVVWEDGSTGMTFNTGALGNDACGMFSLTYTATVVGGTVADCPDDVSLTFTINVLPNLTAMADLEINDCGAILMDYCEDASVSYTVNGGDPVSNDVFEGTPGEGPYEVIFTLTDANCSMSLTTNVECGSGFECPVLAYPDDVQEDYTICAGESLTLDISIVSGATEDDVEWSTGETGTTSITYLSPLEVPCEGLNESVQAFVAYPELIECPDAFKIYNITVLPDPLAGINVSVSNCNIVLNDVCDGYDVSYSLNEGETQTGTDVVLDPGLNNVNFTISNDVCSATFSEEAACADVGPICPSLVPAEGLNPNIFICSGESVAFSVLVFDAEPEDVMWSDGTIGLDFNSPILTNLIDCNSSIQQLSATIPGELVEGCLEPFVLTLNVTVLPDPAANADIVVDNENCTIRLVGACEDTSVSYSVNEGDIQAGDSYETTAGNVESVAFFLENDCGMTSLEGTASCLTSTACPSLVVPAGVPLEYTVCAGESIPLMIDIENGVAEQIEWTDGSTGNTGMYTAPDFVECNGGMELWGAYLSETSDCAGDFVGFMINVVPSPSSVEILANEAACSITLLNTCPNFDISYSVNDGPAQDGGIYFAPSGTSGNIEFFVSSGNCEMPILSETFSCSGGGTGLPTGSISGVTWLDANQNGQLDFGEDVIPFVTISLYSLDGTMVIDNTSSEIGIYIFNNLPPGEYYLGFDAGPDYDPSTASYINADGQTGIITVVAGNTTEGINAGYISNEPTVCDLYPPLNINTVAINDCEAGTFRVLASISGGTPEATGNGFYNIITENGFAASVPIYEVFQIGVFPIGSSYTISATDANGCMSTLSDNSECTLPVSLINFEGNAQKEGNLLTWTSASEFNNAYYELASSTNGTDFKVVSHIGGAGTSSLLNKYQFLDINPAGLTYYRLTQTDYDGQRKDLGTIIVNRSANNNELAIVQTNCHNNCEEIRLQFTSTTHTPVNIALYNINGQLLYSQQVNANVGNNELNIVTPSLPNGMYLIRLDNGLTAISTKVLK